MSVINWTDTVTPLNAANMNALEQVVRKGAANGYPSLDAGAKVPLAQLPAGTANGVASLDATGKVPLAQTPLSPVTNGQWLKGVGGVPVWSAIAAADLPPQAVPGYGPTLPASPADGDEYILVDNVNNPALYTWRFRYHAGSSSAYKWEFVGGRPVVVTQGTSQALALSTWQNLSPSTFTVPRAGEYRFEATGYASSGSAVVTVQLVVYLGTPSTQLGSASAVTLPASGWAGTLATAPWWAALTAGGVLAAAGFANAAGASIVFNSYTVLPLRVS
jgi:hypothetical protein